MRKIVLHCVAMAFVVAFFIPVSPPAVAQAANPERYPYRSPRFTQLVAASYQVCGGGDAEEFYRWFEHAYQASGCRIPGREGLSLEALLAAERQEIEGTGEVAEKVKRETALCVWLHRLVKTILPHFSLTEGFEFCNAVRHG